MDQTAVEQIVHLFGQAKQQIPAPVIQVPQGEGQHRLPIKCPIFKRDSSEDFIQFLGRYNAFRIMLNLDEDHSKSALFMSMEEEAGKIARIFCPGTPEYDNSTYEAYCTLLQTMFSSKAESQNAKTKFETRCQFSNEEVQAYAAHKLSLFRIAYVGPNGSEEHLVREFIRGLFNETVRREVIRAMPGTYTAAIELAMNEEAAQLYELSLTKRGNTMDRKPKVNFQSGGVEDMDISSLENHRQKRDSQGRYIQEEGCWGCGSPNHFKRDCPKQKTNYRGRGSYGGRGGYRGKTRGRGSHMGRPAINTLTGEEENTSEESSTQETPLDTVPENEETDF